MPRIVKGAKYIFGWSTVGKDGRIAIPPEAWKEYGFKKGQKAYLLPGSQKSGGFGLSTSSTLKNTQLEAVLQQHSELFKNGSHEGGVITINKRVYSWVMLRQVCCVQIPLDTLAVFE